MRQHSPLESQCLNHALALRDALVAFDESSLVRERAPGERDSFYWLDDDCYLKRPSKACRLSLLEIARNHPEIVADFLEQYGVTSDELRGYAPDEIDPDLWS
jgi:hypothetical protein